MPDEPCDAVVFTPQECRLLLIAIGTRLEKLHHARASGAISGEELDRRIDVWRAIEHKLEGCLHKH